MYIYIIYIYIYVYIYMHICLQYPCLQQKLSLLKHKDKTRFSSLIFLSYMTNFLSVL